jgi:hypothetical protein
VKKRTRPECFFSFRAIFETRSISIYLILLHAPQIQIAWVQNWQIRPQSPIYYSVTKHSRNNGHNCLQRCCSVLLKNNGIGSLITVQEFKKWFEFSLKKNCPIITAALIAHHTPTSPQYDGILWINTGFSADQHLLF